MCLMFRGRGSGSGKEFCQDYRLIADIRVLMFLSPPVWSLSSDLEYVLLLLLLRSGATLDEDTETKPNIRTHTHKKILPCSSTLVKVVEGGVMYE